MQENFPKDLVDGRIAKLLRHSDNAGQHFKNTGALHYFTTLILERGGPTKTGYVYTFGAPGHGKGPFDGYDSAFKNKIHSLIKSYSETGTIPGTRTGYINEVQDVYDALVHFSRRESAVKHKPAPRQMSLNFSCTRLELTQLSLDQLKSLIQ